MTKKTLTAIHADLSKMACAKLHLDTLVPQNVDSEDFHDVSVWSINDIIMRAYAMGSKDQKDGVL